MKLERGVNESSVWWSIKLHFRSIDQYANNLYNNNNLPYLYRIAFSVKMSLLSLRVLLKLKFVK